MALDIMLLEKFMIESEISLALRFYTWKGTWLSIGKNQKYLPESFHKALISKKVKIVRRPSGGNAVLHSGGLTYALIWLSPPRKRHEAYYQASQWLIKAFSELGLPLSFGNQSPKPFERNCFSTSTAADLIDKKGHKRIGSAQLWKKGHLLQHGEILLDPPSELWMEIFNAEAPKPAPSYIPRVGLDENLLQAGRSYWPEVNWRHEQITKIQLDKIAIAAEKFSMKI